MRFRRYWGERLSEAFVSARVWAESAGFLLFLALGFVSLGYASFPADKALWFVMTGVFAVVLLIEVCFVSPYRHANEIMKQLELKNELLNQRTKRQEILESLGKKLDVVQKMVRVCNDTDQIPPTENVQNWERDTCIYLRDNVGEAAESWFHSEVGVPKEPECRFTENRANLLRILHYKSYQLQKIFDTLVLNPEAFQ